MKTMETLVSSQENTYDKIRNILFWTQVQPLLMSREVAAFQKHKLYHSTFSNTHKMIMPVKYLKYGNLSYPIKCNYICDYNDQHSKKYVILIHSLM